MGKSSTNMTYRGILKWAIFPLQNSFTSSSVSAWPGFYLHPCTEFLAILDVRHADYIHVRNLIVVVQVLLDLPGIDVLPAPDYHVF